MRRRRGYGFTPCPRLALLSKPAMHDRVIVGQHDSRDVFGVIMSKMLVHQKSSAGQAYPHRGPEPDIRRRLDAWLDEALEQTFPASDPIATPPYSALPDQAPEHERNAFDDLR